MLHKWYSVTENPDTVIRVIFLDFTKVFDLIDHNLLLSDFQMIGVRLALIPWLASHLSQRQQRVKFDEKLFPSFLTINAAVPYYQDQDQGSGCIFLKFLKSKGTDAGLTPILL